MKNRQYLPPVLLGLLLAAISVTVFAVQIAHRDPDIPIHSELYLKPWGPEIYSHVLYFFLLMPFSGFSRDISAVNTGAIILLTLSTLAKYFILYYFLAKSIQKSPPVRRLRSLPALLAFLLCIVHPIPFGKSPFMVGYLPSNVWHNSTAILAAPFALLMTFQALQLAKNDRASGIFRPTLWVILSILAKPNFFIIFFPVYLLLLFKATGNQLNRRFWLSSIPILAGIALLVIEYLATYVRPADAGIGISPFLVWRNLTPIPWEFCLAGSIAFPMAFLLVSGRSALKDPLLMFSWMLFLIGLLMFVFFYERGDRMFHGNFFWQIVPAMQLLFLSTLVNWLSAGFNQRFSPNNRLLQAKNLLLLLIFATQVCTGFLYIYKILRYDIW